MDLKEGDRLKSDVFNNAGLHVLPKGTSIHKEVIALLIRQHIQHVDIELRENEIPLAGATRQDFSKLLQDNFEIAVKGYQSIFLEALTTGKFSQSMVDEKLQPVLEIIDQKKDVVSLLISLGQEDVNIYNHSLQVGLLSYYIASWLGYSKKECEVISKAGYLHDIGKSQVRQSIRNHEDSLNEEEREEMRRHTVYGYNIIKESVGNEKIAIAALQHHEREDGTGYPNGLSKHDIHPYSQIIAVANTYVGLTTPKEGEEKPGLLTVLRKVYDLGFGELNEKAVQALTRNLLPNFIGKKARLSTGETATIVWNNPMDHFKPLVQVGEDFRDLSVDRNIVVEEVFM